MLRGGLRVAAGRAVPGTSDRGLLSISFKKWQTGKQKAQHLVEVVGGRTYWSLSSGPQVVPNCKTLDYLPMYVIRRFGKYFSWWRPRNQTLNFTSISRQFHVSFTSISRQFYVSFTSVLRQFYVNFTSILHFHVNFTVSRQFYSFTSILHVD